MKKNPQTYIIAEAGVNHNGSLDLAKKLVDAAFEAGANAVKFQTFQAERLVSKSAGKAEYQKEATAAGESQFDMLKRLELDAAAHRKVKSHCSALGIEFLSTPFDEASVDLLAQIGVKRLKLPSGEITNAPLLLKAARTGLPIILSTGMTLLGEIEDALGVLAFGYLKRRNPGLKDFRETYASIEGRQALHSNVSLLHCTTEYPAPFEDVNLRGMDTLRQAFDLPVGYSDHTEGVAIAIAAVARGAALIEKHFTLDRTLPGPDHKASVEPQDLQAMVQAVRATELALGSACKIPTPSEVGNMPVARKSLVAIRHIRPGEIFSAKNLGVKRPGAGLSPFAYWTWLGKKADRDYQPDEMIEP